MTIKKAFHLCIILFVIVMVSCNKPSQIDLPLASPDASMENTSRFLFVGTNKDNSQLLSTYSLTLDGEIQEIADSALWHGYPISPNQKILVENKNDLTQPLSKELFIFDLATNQKVSVEIPSKPTAIFWSPVTNIVVYNLHEENTNYLHFYFVDKQSDKTVKVLYGSEINIFGWSRDGNEIFFLWKNEENQTYDIYSLDSTNFNSKQITNDSDIEVLFAESSGGVFAVGSIPIEEEFYHLNYRSYILAKNLYLLDIDSKETVISITPRTIAWSPDGSQVAVSNDGNLCFLKIGSSNLHCPIKNFLPLNKYRSASVFSASWSSDGNFVVFQSINQQTGCHETYLFNLLEEIIITPTTQTCLSSPFFMIKNQN